ncbi:MAG: alanine racemase, partial [Hungatella sp.]
MRPYARVYVDINLDAVIHNMEAMQQNLTPGTGMIGVVKTDAYGHGAVQIAQTIEPYVWGYAVASVEEAMILRRHGIVKPILVLGVTHESAYPELVEYDIRSAMFQLAHVKKLSAVAVAMGKTAKIHLALDTGMSRIGMEPDAASADMVKEMSALE